MPAKVKIKNNTSSFCWRLYGIRVNYDLSYLQQFQEPEVANIESEYSDTSPGIATVDQSQEEDLKIESDASMTPSLTNEKPQRPNLSPMIADTLQTDTLYTEESEVKVEDDEVNEDDAMKKMDEMLTEKLSKRKETQFLSHIMSFFDNDRI